MCNACGFYCCASDVFSGCGCDHCHCEECWSDDPEDEYEDEPLDDGPYSEAEINSRREITVTKG